MLNVDSYIVIWAVLEWLIYLIIMSLAMLRIEDVLNKKEKKKQNIIISKTKMSEKQNQIFNEAFKNFNTIFQRENDFSEFGNAPKVIYPKCGSRNIAELHSKKRCLDCGCKFSFEK